MVVDEHGGNLTGRRLARCCTCRRRRPRRLDGVHRTRRCRGPVRRPLLRCHAPDHDPTTGDRLPTDFRRRADDAWWFWSASSGDATPVCAHNDANAVRPEPTVAATNDFRAISGASDDGPRSWRPRFASGDNHTTAGT